MNNNSESEIGSVGAVYCRKGDTATPPRWGGGYSNGVFKRCTKCNVVKTIDEYYKRINKKNGNISYRSHCKVCVKKHINLYRQDNKDKRKAVNS